MRYEKVIFLYDGLQCHYDRSIGSYIYLKYVHLKTLMINKHFSVHELFHELSFLVSN